jgi:hypothetical protein
MTESANKENWLKLIKELRESGKSQRKWCEEKEISHGTLKYWLKRVPDNGKIARQEETKQKTHLESQLETEQKTRWLKLNVNAQTPAPLQSTERIENPFQLDDQWCQAAEADIRQIA